MKEEDISKKDREIIKKVIFKGTNFESKFQIKNEIKIYVPNILCKHDTFPNLEAVYPSCSAHFYFKGTIVPGPDVQEIHKASPGLEESL